MEKKLPNNDYQVQRGYVSAVWVLNSSGEESGEELSLADPLGWVSVGSELRDFNNRRQMNVRLPWHLCAVFEKQQHLRRMYCSRLFEVLIIQVGSDCFVIT